MATDTDRKVVECMLNNGIGFATSVPCKQLAGVIDLVERSDRILHVPSNKEDEGMGLCAGAHMGGMNSCILMQNTALGVVVNTLATLIQFYNIPLPMLISFRGEVGEKVACQAEMAIHTKPLLDQLHVPWRHLSRPEDAGAIDGIIRHAHMCRKPVAILADAQFWGSGR